MSRESTQNKAAQVGCITEFTAPQFQKRDFSLNLKLDGGVNMDAKKLKINFKQLTIGVTFSVLTTTSVLP